MCVWCVYVCMCVRLKRSRECFRFVCRDGARGWVGERGRGCRCVRGRRFWSEGAVAGSLGRRVVFRVFWFFSVAVGFW